MAIWVVRAGKYGEREELALDEGVAVSGWPELPDLTKTSTRDELDHRDHHGGLDGFVPRLGRASLPLTVHPHAWRERKAVFPNGTETHLPPPRRADSEREGWQITDETGHSLLFESMVLVTGQVERVTDFEKGFPIQQALLNGEWQPDPLVCDDQALVMQLPRQVLGQGFTRAQPMPRHIVKEVIGDGPPRCLGQRRGAHGRRSLQRRVPLERREPLRKCTRTWIDQRFVELDWSTGVGADELGAPRSLLR